MKVKLYLFSLSKNLDSLFAALIGFTLIQIFSKHSGIGVSPDSVTYLSVARHMTEGRGFLSFDNLPVVDFPFAYPLFLAIISFFTRQDPLLFGAWLNGILFGMLLYASGAIMNEFHKSGGWYKRIILSCILLSPALQEVYSLLWSETIFLLLILAFIISISGYLRQTNWKWLFLSTGICAIACLTRYAGVFLVLTGITLIFFNEGYPWRKRIIQGLLFGGLSILFLLINIFRNLTLTGLAMGPRPKNDTGIFKNMEYFGGVLCDWLLIERRPALAFVLTVLAVLIFISTIAVTYRRKKTGLGLEYAVAVTGLMYCLFMLITSSLTRYEQFTNRLLSPMYVPLLWSLSWWAPGLISKMPFRFKWVATGFFLLAASWYLNRQLTADWEYYDGVKDAGIPGYREDPFVQSEIVQYVEKNKKEFDPRFQIYSNAGDAVYFITGLAARQLPYSVFPANVQQYYASKNNYLIWFRDLDNPEMPILDSILKNKELILLKQLSDGAVYISR
jgi:hypothetical protein